MRTSWAGLLLCACTRVESEAAPDPSHERAPRVITTDPDAVYHETYDY